MTDYPFTVTAQDGEELTAEMVEAMAAWSFFWDTGENRVMLCDDD